MLKHIAFILALLAAGPATALSCMRPSIENSFRHADDREESFVIALGQLMRSGENVPDGPESGNQNQRASYSFPAVFRGHFASSQGFVVERSADVTVDVRCVAVWCGSDSLSRYGLYFLRVDANGYSLESGPCPLFFFDNPTDAQVTEVIGLLR